MTSDGKCISRFRIAVPRTRDNTDFFNISAWKANAEFVRQYFRKGNRIIVHGSLRNNDYTDREGIKHYATEILADKFEFADTKSGKGNSQQNSSYQNQNMPNNSAQIISQEYGNYPENPYQNYSDGYGNYGGNTVNQPQMPVIYPEKHGVYPANPQQLPTEYSEKHGIYPDNSQQLPTEYSEKHDDYPANSQKIPAEYSENYGGNAEQNPITDGLSE